MRSIPIPVRPEFYRRPGARFDLPVAERLCGYFAGELTLMASLIVGTLEADRPGCNPETVVLTPRAVATEERPYFRADDDVALGWVVFRYSDRHPDARLTIWAKLDYLRLWVDDNFGVLGPLLGRWCLEDENLVPIERAFRPAQGLDGNRWGIGEGSPPDPRKAPPPRG